MNHRTIKYKNEIIPRLGVGCWQLAGSYSINNQPNGYGGLETGEAAKSLNLLLDNGIRFFDTAQGYGEGASEKFLGDILKNHVLGSKALVCSKTSVFKEENFSGQKLEESVRQSLRNLQRSFLDILLLHNPNDDFIFSKSLKSALETLVSKGLIKSYGVSCKSVKGVDNVIKQQFGEVIEAIYNPIDRRLESRMRENSEYLFICRVPFASGFITKKTLMSSRSFSNFDIRSNFPREQCEWVENTVKNLSFLDNSDGFDTNVLRFQFSNTFNSVVIPGIRKISHATSVLDAWNKGSLDKNQISLIETAVPQVYEKW